jgi:hypothetical protein
MSAETITIGDQEFRPRRRTYKALLDAAPHQDAIGDARDDFMGVQAELSHAEDRVVALSEAEGDFDLAALDELKRHRAELRRRATEIAVGLFRLRLDEVGARLEPQPEVDFLMEHLDDRGLDDVVEWLNARPTKAPSETESEAS